MAVGRSGDGDDEAEQPFTWWSGRPQADEGDLDGLAADRELLRMANAEDFAGEFSDKLTRELVRYALALMVRLIESGAILARLRQLLSASGQLFYLPPRSLTAEEINMLTYDSVQGGLQIFLRNERSGKGWVPDRGASLTTYFVNCCILGFRTPWKQMVVNMRRPSQPEARGLYDRVWTDVADGSPGPEQQAISLHEVRRLIGSIPDELNRQIVCMTALGYSCAAIGEVLDLKEHAVSERLRRLRQRNLRKRTKYREEEVDDGAGRAG
ncbi:MAG: hypothetical protein LC799_17045 [Actinobacteria bacterium]|nr:hypothetical protein [Actinomycetota bacterium]